MREKILVDLLLNSKKPLKLPGIVRKMDYSESTIRNLIKDINDKKVTNGFMIRFKREKGYFLEIVDQNRFDNYISELNEEIDLYNTEQRVEATLFYILQTNGYITIAKLMEWIQVGRSTIINDLKSAQKILAKFNLELEKKPHYGIAVKGKEQDFRRAFSKYVLQSKLYIKPTKQYGNFLRSLEMDKISHYFRSLLLAHQLTTSEVVIENLLIHLKIVMFRVKQANTIKKDKLIIKEINPVYYEFARELTQWIEVEFKITLPEEEIQFLAAHISAKANTVNMDVNRKKQLFNDLRFILKRLDEEFLTNFSTNDELIEGLLLHIYPLLNRLYYNLQLENPLIDELEVKYTNVFIVALRFGELIEKKYDYSLTRDEIGYIALHLAAHFEREKQVSLNKVKRIVVVCSTGGGSAQLIRLKLERIFPQALVMTVSNKNISSFKEDLPDLFLTTIPVTEKFDDIPIIHIKNFLDEIEVKRIVDKTALYISEKKTNHRILNIQSLFSENCFQTLEKGNYLEIIKKQGNEMIERGLASSGFTELVLEREERFSTIYDKGVAGPHPIRLDALKNTIGVTILKNPIIYKGKEVQVIFLINLKQDHLFLHKEISKLLIQLMDDEMTVNQLCSVNSFEQFMKIIEKLM